MRGNEAQAIRILFVEDLEVDAERALHQIRRAGLTCVWKRIETEAALISALQEFAPTIIVSDFSLPQFDGMSALRITKQIAPDVPFIFVSGTIGEERAIQALHAGAVDYVLKDNLARFVPALQRAISEAAAERERKKQGAQIARLNRVLRMQSGVNGLVLRIRDRTELLRETCRLAVSVGDYAMAIAAAEVPGMVSIQPVAWTGLDRRMTEQMRAYVGDSAAREGSIIDRVIRTGKEFVCNNTADLEATVNFDALMIHSGMLSVVVLPLKVENTTIAVLVLTARDSDMVSEEELAMLREVAGNLSFGLQYLQRDTRAHFLSHFDPQTSLAKRPLFCERAQRLVNGATTGQRSHQAVVVMDIERLSVINDSFGRRIGDLLLQHVADRLKQVYPQTEQIAHFGGGTFALLRPLGERSDEEVRIAGQRQTGTLFGEPFVIEGQAIPVSVRSGIALSPDDGGDAMTLVQNAEAALHYARISSEQHVRYNAAARSQLTGRMALEHRLRLALEHNEFELHYQPKLNIATRRIQGAEALLRWRHPDDGLISPAAFLPVLEATGLIVQVGDWVMRRAAEDCQRWMQAGVAPLRIAVNIAPAQLRQLDFESNFLKIVMPWCTADWGLDIEITEGMLQENSPTEVGKLERLRDHDIKIAIDDFGTGYSSLSRLATLPIDTLKIDRSFVIQSLRSESGASLIRTIIALAKALGMTTVAEGVEKEEEFALLAEMGCDKSQGFLHSPAVTAAQFTALLQRDTLGR